MEIAFTHNFFAYFLWYTLTMAMEKISITLFQKCICWYSLAHSGPSSVWQIV